jgi:uncharacterized membrane protein YdcZ (DUF606 family)
MLLLHFGPPVAIVAAAAEAGVISLRTSKRWTSWFGSPAMAALAMLAAGSVYTWAQSRLADSGGPPITVTFTLAISTAFVYFAVGTLLMTSLIRLKRNEPIAPLRTLREHYWIGMAYGGSAVLASLLTTSFGRLELSAFVVSAPIVAMFLTGLHAYVRRGADGKL